MDTVEVNGAKLAYFEMGKGAPIVLVHPNISDHRSWGQLIPILAEKHRVISYSRRYHWPNTPLPEGADDAWVTHVDDLASLIETRKLGRPHVVGCSAGAVAALVLSQRRPDLVCSMVLEEPPLMSLFMSLPPRWSELIRLLFLRPTVAWSIGVFSMLGLSPAINAFRRGDDEQGLHYFTRVLLGAAFYSSLTPERSEQMRDNLKPHRAALLNSNLPILTEDEIRKIQTPALVLCGIHSASVLQHLVSRLAELLPNGEQQVIHAASHFLHEDNAPATAQAILDFIQQRTTRFGAG